MDNNTNSTPIESFNKFIDNIAKKECAITGKKINDDVVNNLYEEYKKKLNERFEVTITNLKDEEKIVLNNAIYLWCLPNNRKSQYISCTGFEKLQMPKEAVAGGGSGYVQTKVKGVCFILYILSQIWGKEDKNEIKKTIIDICNGKHEPYTTKESLPDGVKNLLMHLCYPQKYEPIASTGDKEKIVKCFYDLATLQAANGELEKTKENTEDPVLIKNAFDAENKLTEAINDVENKVKAVEEAKKAVEDAGDQESKEELEKAKEKLNTAKIEFQEAKKRLRNAKLAKSEADNSLTLDRKIELIKKHNPIVKAYKDKDKDKYNIDDKSFSFYNNILPLIWKGESNSSTLSRAQLLEYKKAMVLYGPPGTGKTYTAMELAKQIQIRYIISKYKKGGVDVDKIFEEVEELYKDNVYYLQFHINHTYENFIAGQTVQTDENKNTTLETKRGFIYDIIDKANAAIKNADKNENAAPFIVILDEMNRVDVSRVFGELFTAIEKRGTDVFLTLPDPDNNKERLKLNIPYNIYFIGTMNEIDFSLEQIDFALRRRFIWELADYSENALEEIIKERIEIEDFTDFSKNFTDFLNNCTALNEKIADKLGEEYHIGHAFFAEIANIYNELIENNSSGNAFKQAQNILWQISIRPTIEAYCGTMEKNAQKTFIDECHDLFKLSSK